MTAAEPAASALGPGALIDAVASAVLIVDASAAARPIVYVNDAFVRLTSYERTGVLGRSPSSLMGGQSDPVVAQQLREAINTAVPLVAECVISRSDGSPLWTRWTVRPAQVESNQTKRVVVTLEDISAYKRACESLRVSEARLDVAMQASGLSMWDWNVPLDEIYYNDRWREALGVDPRELLDRGALSERLMLPPDDAAVLGSFEQHFHGRSACFEAEYNLPGAPGARWVRALAKVVRRDASGKPERMIGVLRDITPQKHAVERALHTQRRWERAVHGTSDGLYDWDLLTGHVWYAARFREIVGYDERDFPDTFVAFQNVLHADDRSLVLGKIRSHLENRKPLDIRCRVRTRSGEALWCRLRGEAERDAAGRPQRLSGSLSDISAQIDAEQALTRSQDFYGTILDSLPLFIAYMDGDERLIYLNRVFEEFLGIALADSRGVPIRDVLGAARYDAVSQHLRDALRGTTVEGQARFESASGQPIDLDTAFMPHRDESGEIQGCFVAARDVTQQRQLEASLRQSQKMEAVGRLTGGISHDFNNLLSVIIGNLQLLERTVHGDHRQLRHTETALSAALRGASLTRRLLAFARQQVLEPRTLDLNAMVNGMYELMRRTLAGNVEIQRELATDAWPTRADPGQLENAVLNLAINARDAMPAGGVITIVTRNVALGPQRQLREHGLLSGDYVVLEVRDTGVGMSAETLKRVFEPFFTTKDVGKGTGLGLSIVYGFVKQSGGHVSIASAPGQGTSVHLYFPRTQSECERASLDAGSCGDLPRGHETVLVVEDNTDVRATAVAILGSLGYRPLEAANGHEALELFMRHPDIALVFSDIMLPGGLLGTQLAQRLAERRPGLRVLLTSGFSETGMMSRGVLDGSIDLLPKPYRVEDLARRVRARLDAKEEDQRVPA